MGTDKNIILMWYITDMTDLDRTIFSLFIINEWMNEWKVYSLKLHELLFKWEKDKKILHSYIILGILVLL